MSWKDRCVELLKKYGPAAKVVAGAVLNVVAPGSAALVGLVDKAFDAADKLAQGHWEAELMRATQQNADELARLGSLFELLTGDLAKLCDKAFAFHDQPDEIEDIVRRALASDRGLTDGLRKLDALVDDFACVKEQQRRLLDGQDEMLPIMRRLQSVLPFLEECQQAGANPRELLGHRQAILLGIQLRQPQQARSAVKRIEDGGKHGDTHLFKAGIALVDRDFPSVQSELGEVVRRHPHDNELVELHRRATVMATGLTPRVAPANPGADATRLADVNPDLGDVLDGWKLEARLGSGGWGQVFKATRGAETVALKIMHVRYSRDADFVARFRGEIRSLMRLPSHPNLLRILDFNYAIERSCWYLVMEYIDGPTLDKYLQDKGALSAEQAHKVFAPVTDGLAQAHAAGIVHRDIKPGNFVFRKKDQQLVLVDFGLAVHAENVGQTKIGGLTLMFGSPEQKSGLPADARGDVYSLAATISFALLYDKPDLRNPIHFDAGEIPLTLRAALAKAMETNPRRRFADGGEFHAALLKTLSPASERRADAEPEPLPPVAKLAPPVPRPSESAAEFFGIYPGDAAMLDLAQEFPAPKRGQLITNSLGMKFAWVAPGASWLGGGGGNPGPAPFTLEQGLWCGIYPVTQAEWQQVMGPRWSRFPDNPRYPIDNVSWMDVQKFLEKLNLRGDGYSYRLPPEQEWEYICRGGPIDQDQSKYHFYFAKSKTDLTSMPTDNLSSREANFYGNSPAGSASKGPCLGRPSDVGSYLPNPLGIFDMHGNVCEWTASREGSCPVIRGVGWNDSSGAVNCTASHRSWFRPDLKAGGLGFRVLAVPSSAALLTTLSPVSERRADADPAPPPPVAKPVTPAAPNAESPADRVRRLKTEAAKLHEDARAAIQRNDYNAAADILEGFRPELTGLRDAALFAAAVGKRDRLRLLHKQVHERLNSGKLNDPRLPGLIAAFLDIEPGDAAMLDLAREFPVPKRGQPITNALGMQFVWVPPGASWLGGGLDFTWKGNAFVPRDGDGTPGTKPFTLEQGLWCGIYPVTQAEWQAVMGDAPSKFSGNPRYPVESVNWNRVQDFLKKLNGRLSADGLTYRLPTKQEWEYICRGGPIDQDQSKFNFYFAKSKTDLTPNPTNDLTKNQANFHDHLKRPSDVGSYLPNPLGIYDMHGNVFEWTATSEGGCTWLRGGNWSHDATDCRAHHGYPEQPGNHRSDTGFRLLAVPSSE